MPTYPTYSGDQMQTVNTGIPLDTLPEADTPGWLRYIQQWVKGTFDVCFNLNGTLKNGVVTLASLGISTFIQRVRTEITSVTPITDSVPKDNTIPQNDEGAEIATAAITPSSASNKIILRLNLTGRVQGVNSIAAAFFKDSDADAIAAASFPQGQDGNCGLFLEREFSAGSTSARTYKVRVGPLGSGTFTPNVASDGATFGAVIAGFFEVIEWKV